MKIPNPRSWIYLFFFSTSIPNFLFLLTGGYCFVLDQCSLHSNRLVKVNLKHRAAMPLQAWPIPPPSIVDKSGLFSCSHGSILAGFRRVVLAGIMTSGDGLRILASSLVDIHLSGKAHTFVKAQELHTRDIMAKHD